MQRRRFFVIVILVLTIGFAFLYPRQTSHLVVLDEKLSFTSDLGRNHSSSRISKEAPWLSRVDKPEENTTFYNRTLTLVVYIRGELCNHLSVLAGARLIQRYVEKELPGVQVNLIGQHQDAPKWLASRTALPLCFPNFRKFEFTGGQWDPEFRHIQARQQKWLNTKASMLQDISTPQQVEYLKSLLDQQQTSASGEQNSVPTSEPSGSKYSLPYLTAYKFAPLDGVLLENVHTYEDMRSWFRFDNQACCTSRAEPNETVFHFRNFVSEIESASTREAHGFVELSPNETVHSLFDNNKNNRPKKVAIISRYKDTARPYVTAFQQHGFEARLIEGQSGMRDFCFAMSADTFVGLKKSTYTFWAGLLGNATLVRWYTVVDNATLRQQKEVDVVPIQGREFSFEVHSRRVGLTEELLKKSPGYIPNAATATLRKRTSQKLRPPHRPKKIPR